MVRVRVSLWICEDVHFRRTSLCPRFGKWWKSVLGQSLGPKVGKKFSKARVSVRVRVRFSFWICENVHFWLTRLCPRLGRWWKKCFWTKFGSQSVEEVGFFQKLGLALGLGLDLAFEFVKMSTFDWPDCVQGWGGGEKSVFGQSLGPKVWKRWAFFQKLGLALGLGLGLAFQGIKMSTFDGPDCVRGWESNEKVFLDNVWAPKCGRSGLFFKF